MTSVCVEYEIGDLVWAKVGTYPWWPCMVSSDPQLKVHIRINTRGNNRSDTSHYCRKLYAAFIFLPSCSFGITLYLHFCIHLSASSIYFYIFE